MNRANFIGRDFLTLMEYSREEIAFMLDVAMEIKAKFHQKTPHEYLRGRTVAMLFEKPSTRTRLSFKSAAAQLGMQCFYLRPDELQLARGEPIRDTARVIDRYCDALIIRTFGQEIVDEFAHYMDHPVINALTDLIHPCQGLADLMVIREKKGRLEGLKMAYVGDVYNIAHTLMVVCSTMGIDLYIARPEGYEPNEAILRFSSERARLSGSQLVFTTNLEEAVSGADVVYTNTWHSMGMTPAQLAGRRERFAPYQVNSAVMALAKEDAIFMHCLPCYRGEEVTEEVVEGPQSVVWDEAENRMHTEAAIMYLLIP